MTTGIADVVTGVDQLIPGLNQAASQLGQAGSQAGSLDLKPAVARGDFGLRMVMEGGSQTSPGPNP